MNSDALTFNVSRTKTLSLNATQHRRMELLTCVALERNKAQFHGPPTILGISLLPGFVVSKLIYFIISSEINAYRKQIEMISITSEMI